MSQLCASAAAPLIVCLKEINRNDWPGEAIFRRVLEDKHQPGVDDHIRTRPMDLVKPLKLTPNMINHQAGLRTGTGSSDGNA